MMNVHTTQDLGVLTKQQLSPINKPVIQNIRFTGRDDKLRGVDANADGSDKKSGRHNYKFINATVLLSGVALVAGLLAAFSKKKAGSINSGELEKNVRNLKEKVQVGDIKEHAIPEMVKGDKFLKSKFFEKLLKLTENEPVAQAAMSACICILLRPLTIMALPNKKGKEDNMYASAHSISSGIMGLISALIIAQPFKSGAKYAMDKDKMLRNFKEDALLRLFPKLNIESIYEDASKKVRKPVKEWKFIDGNAFMTNFKDVDKIPILKHFNEISAETYKNYLNTDVNWAQYKGKSFNEVFDKNGKPLYDVIDWKRLGIIVDQKYVGTQKVSKKMLKECTGKAQVLLQDLDRNFLEKVIKDADMNSNWKNLDVNSVYDGKRVVDFRKWKDLNGNQWKLDLDNAYISSPLDTTIYTPRISGKERITPTGEIKYATYLKNGKNNELGSVLDEEMIKTDKNNEVHDKILTWLPDIVTRPLVAAATVSLIPIALQRIFHLEKGKKSAPQDTAQQPQASFKGNNDDSQENNISFKGSSSSTGGKRPSKLNEFFSEIFEKFIAKPLAKIYGKPMYESTLVRRIAERLSKMSGGMTRHMATLGSLLTSSVYMYQTLHKKDLDLEDNRKRTLAVNQGLCFIIPTICAYTVDSLINNWTKEKIEYRYSNLTEHEIAKAALDPKRAGEVKAIQENLGVRLKSIRTLVSLAIFALVYRYIAPVLITPVANKIGNRINEKKQTQNVQSS